uniref:WRKY domain-containing protein n=1 Tax=Oryza barthii TaxID=65489 RepID=A0A0D3GT39_9ORYZ
MAAARRVAGGGGGSLWGPPQPPPSTGGGIPQLPAAAAAPVEGLLDAPFSSSSGGGGGGWPPPPPPLSGTAVLIGYPQGNFETFPQQDLVPLTAQEVHSKCITFGRAENLSFIPLATSALVSQHTGSSSVNVTPLQEILTSPSQISNVNTESIGVLQGLPASSIVLDRPTDDGYNWRKYGQKAVKGGEYPKSYYKCTHLNCLVRKNVEHSADGRIVQIIYRGQHTHERPSKRRFKDCGGISDDLDDFSGTTGTSVRSQPDYDDYCRKPIIPSGTMVAPLVKKIEDGDDQLSGSSDNQDEHDDEKVVKGNPYPRSYYKCTYLGCDVKKQVERSVEEPNAVITTYEGKHIHDVPAARNKSHVVANASLLQNTKSNTYCTEQSYTTITC